MVDNLAGEVMAMAVEERDYVADLLQRLVRIPSPSCGEAEVIGLLKREMETYGIDEVFTDSIGNVVGRFGAGRSVILYDSHVDTVGVGDRSAWKIDPFAGIRQDGIIYGRGASDNKAGIACMIAGLKVLTRIARKADFTLYVAGVVQEEDCEGLSLSVLLDERAIRPDCVVLGECTNLAVNRGHRGRAEIEIVTKGISCHASAPERGDNAVYRMTPIIEGIKWMADKLSADPFLGRGTIAVTKVDCATPSVNAVPDLCRIHVDRRIVPADTRESIVREIEEVARFTKGEVRISTYSKPSYKGYKEERLKFFPAWTVDEASKVVVGASTTYHLLFGTAPRIGKWDFSTDGNYSMGVKAIPTVGFGPAEERHAHAADDQVRVDDLYKSVAFYALFPFVYST